MKELTSLFRAYKKKNETITKHSFTNCFMRFIEKNASQNNYNKLQQEFHEWVNSTELDNDVSNHKAQFNELLDFNTLTPIKQTLPPKTVLGGTPTYNDTGKKSEPFFATLVISGRPVMPISARQLYQQAQVRREVTRQNHSPRIPQNITRLKENKWHVVEYMQANSETKRKIHGKYFKLDINQSSIYKLDSNNILDTRVIIKLKENTDYIIEFVHVNRETKRRIRSHISKFNINLSAEHELEINKNLDTKSPEINLKKINEILSLYTIKKL